MAELPVALPAAERTVGQLIAESIRSYGQEFWHCLPLGLPLALADQLNIQRSWQEQPLVFLLLGATLRNFNPELEEAARMAGGDLDRARLLATDPGIFARREAFASVVHRVDGTGARVMTATSVEQAYRRAKNNSTMGTAISTVGDHRPALKPVASQAPPTSANKSTKAKSNPPRYL